VVDREKKERKTLFDPDKHLVGRGGKSFITYVGLQAKLADQGKGTIYSRTDVLQNGDDHESGRWAVRVNMKIKHFETGEVADLEAIGDASVENVGSMVSGHLPRMAETRAKVRVLREATRSEFTAYEEIGSEDSDERVA
jgi:hypothetical protein